MRMFLRPSKFRLPFFLILSLNLFLSFMLFVTSQARAADPARASLVTRTLQKLFPPSVSDLALSTEQRQLVNELSQYLPELNPKVLALALQAQACAKANGLTKSDVLTIIDYSKPSTQERLFVIDVAHAKALFHTLVAHGKNSGRVESNTFSDQPQSLQSSIGVYTTGGIYSGKNGESLELHGQEVGYNQHAYNRRIVMHGAPYVSEEMVKNQGYLGRSWGCPAIKQALIHPIANTIKNGSLLFAYYPDQKWLKKSRFLHCSAGQ